jgi:hypothetical protein
MLTTRPPKPLHPSLRQSCKEYTYCKQNYVCEINIYISLCMGAPSIRCVNVARTHDLADIEGCEDLYCVLLGYDTV